LSTGLYQIGPKGKPKSGSREFGVEEHHRWSDPFPVVNGDRNTRVIVFVRNLQLAQGKPASSVVVSLVDVNHQNYDVPAEIVRPVSNSDFVQVIFRLPDNLAVGKYTVTIKAHGQMSNAGTIRIRI
jgi:5-hydroxyisourate hydrolase-like protein (transthyretin family)